jgi:hypothetical protein
MSMSRSLRDVVTLIVLLGAIAGCGGHPGDDRDTMLAHADVRRLVGAWEVTLLLDRPASEFYDSVQTARSVSGTIAFTENRRSDATLAGFGEVTHKAVYDLDLSPFHLPAGGGAGLQPAVARTASMNEGNAPSSEDSVTIALDPEDTRFAVRLRGVLAGDSVAGTWTAEFLRTAAVGRFVMRRRQPRA